MKKCMLFLLTLLVFTACNKEDYYPDEDFNFTEDDFDPDFDDGGSEGDEEGALTLYKINGDAITHIKDYEVPSNLKNYQDDKGRHQEIWDFVTRLIPSDARGKISEFEIFFGDNELLGYVVPIDENDLSRWKFALAIDVAGDLTTIDFGELFTLVTIHEYAHVMTLNDEQINVGGSPESCNAFFTGEGCSKSGSYINRLYDLGWADIYANHDHDNPEATYERYKDRFVSDYAATNPGEDIAEVFSFFVAQADAPTGNTIADQKIKLMYEFPELVEMRDRMRASGTVNGLSANSLGTHRSFDAKKHRLSRHGDHGHGHEIHRIH